MSTDSSKHRLQFPAASSIFNDPNTNEIDSKEDDAALVDSFFLPGGLFADEINNVHQNESKITNTNDNMHIGSISQNSGSRSNVHLPQNPWEVDTSTSTSAMAISRVVPRIEPLYVPPLRVSLAPTENSNNDHDKSLVFDEKLFNSVESESNRIHSINKYREKDDCLKGTTIAHTAHQKTDVIISCEMQQETAKIESVFSNGINESRKVLRPPPGFQKTPTVVFPINVTSTTSLAHKQYQTLSSNSSSGGPLDVSATSKTDFDKKYLFQAYGGRSETIADKRISLAADNPCDSPGQTPSLENRTLNRQLDTLHHTLMHPSKKLDSVDLKSTELQVPTCVRSDECPMEENQSYLVQYLKTSQASDIIQDKNKNESTLEATAFSIPFGSERKPKESNDYIGDDYDVDDAEGDIQEEDNEESSIPFNISFSVDADTNYSSLSTYSDVDNNSELSSTGSGNNHQNSEYGLMDEGVGYDTDQAHVSQIIDVMGNSVSSAAENDETIDDEQFTSSAQTDVRLEALPSKIPPTTDIPSRGSKDQKNTYSAVKLIISFLRSVAELWHSAGDGAVASVRSSSLYAFVSIRYERFLQRVRKLSLDFQKIMDWLIDVEEVFEVLMKRLLKVGRKYSKYISEARAVVLWSMFQLMKFSLIEAVEEFSGVTSCYLVFYCMPGTCLTLMEYINLPHWTPHTMTWLAIFSLCHQVETATLPENSNFSLSYFSSLLVADTSVVPAIQLNDGATAESPSPKNPSNQNLQSQQQEKFSHEHDKQICFVLLKVLRIMLPILYMVEGFSSEFGSIIGVNGANRLTAAFALSILRKSLISSPIGWFSWALQVLLAAYCSSWIFLDLFILLMGLSSIRLIRFIDLQRTQRRRRYEKSSK